MRLPYKPSFQHYYPDSYLLKLFRFPRRRGIVINYCLPNELIDRNREAKFLHSKLPTIIPMNAIGIKVTIPFPVIL